MSSDGEDSFVNESDWKFVFFGPDDFDLRKPNQEELGREDSVVDAGFSTRGDTVSSDSPEAGMESVISIDASVAVSGNPSG